MSKKKVAVIGAGPGGLTAAMVLAARGYAVELFERAKRVGGRNAKLEIGPFTFDTGPTFLMMIDILEDAFKLAGRDLHELLDIKRIDPLYRLQYSDGRAFFPTANQEHMKEQINRLFPGNWKGYQRYMKYEAKKFDRIASCLRVPYDSLADYVRPRMIKALPYLDAHTSLYKHLSKYFDSDDLRVAFTFQAKYLGMSPWNCPATFSIISYIEHHGGIYHPIGGLYRISEVMADVIREEGGQIHLNTPVREIIVRDGEAKGVRLEDGSEKFYDYLVLNADFGYAMNELVPRSKLKRWTPEKLEQKDLSCSTFMIYLGIDKRYDDIPHHNILFAEDYRKNVSEIADSLTLSDDPSIYIQNACVTDPSLAPEGKSTIYLLVPVPNNRGAINWDKVKDEFREKVLNLVETRGGLTNLRDHIEVERIITPDDWENRANVYRGAVFNLAHSIDQMLYFRPHNVFEEFDRCYLVGGGTHPGSGLPTIYESGVISAGQIMKRDAWYLKR